MTLGVRGLGAAALMSLMLWSGALGGWMRRRC